MKQLNLNLKSDFQFKLLAVREASEEKADSPEAIYEMMKQEARADRECFWVLHLNQRLKIIEKELVSMGIVNASLAHPREVFKKAIINGASAIITVHNHPSGSLQPSDDDFENWARLTKAGELLGIPVKDHLIISTKGFYSHSQSTKKHGQGGLDATFVKESQATCTDNALSNLNTENLLKVKQRLSAELASPDLPPHRKCEIESYLYYLEEDLRFRRDYEKCLEQGSRYQKTGNIAEFFRETKTAYLQKENESTYQTKTFQVVCHGKVISKHVSFYRAQEYIPVLFSQDRIDNSYAIKPIPKDEVRQSTVKEPEVIEYTYCDVCGAKVKIYYNWITGRYEGECPCCHKWFAGYK